MWGVAGDDAHLNPGKRSYSDAGRAWVEVWADSPGREPVLAALRRGAFFSTQGPTFESIEVTPRAMSVRSSPVRQIRWRTWGKTGFVDDAPAGGTLTASSLPEWFVPRVYVRVELVDESGRRAWSNPVYVRHSP